jgi:hypothetical protein
MNLFLLNDDNEASTLAGNLLTAGGQAVEAGIMPRPILN